MAKVTLAKKEKEKIRKLRKEFPVKILVKVSRSEDGGFVAEIASFEGCYTQGNTLSELVEMVNDCVKCYFNIPERYYPYMPTYLPPVKVAHDLDIFPTPIPRHSRLKRELVRGIVKRLNQFGVRQVNAS